MNVLKASHHKEYPVVQYLYNVQGFTFNGMNIYLPTGWPVCTENSKTEII